MYSTHLIPAPRRGKMARGNSAVLSVAVLDALPSPTVLLDSDGIVLLTNRAWEAAVETVGDERIEGGVGIDYFATARRACGNAVGRRIVASLRALSRGERESVAADYSVKHPTGTRWYHLRASRVGEEGQVVVTHTDVTDRVQAEQVSAWQARHDDLTALPNRAALHELIDAERRRLGGGDAGRRAVGEPDPTGLPPFAAMLDAAVRDGRLGPQRGRRCRPPTASHHRAAVPRPLAAGRPCRPLRTAPGSRAPARLHRPALG